VIARAGGEEANWGYDVNCHLLDSQTCRGYEQTGISPISLQDLTIVLGSCIKPIKSGIKMGIGNLRILCFMQINVTIGILRKKYFNYLLYQLPTNSPFWQCNSFLLYAYNPVTFS
jgi:hypothetical protein